ncbi:MAG: SBBP repeat-containing protein [Candidatus Hydrogenedentes bacterium]|nr:SBBP repeat-containing protein [Candidatus Hydrogenedentota bacterium]
MGSFDAVWYESLYPGVSLELTGNRTGIKYNFHVAPGADPESIRLRYEDIQGLRLTPDGALEIRVKEGWAPLTDGEPYLYQEANGEKKTVAGGFVLVDDHSYGFAVTGAYDTTLPLVIDPAVAWGTYLGGTGDDYGYGIAADASGNCYATGYTNTAGWVSGGWNTTLQGTDGFVVKLSAAGAHLWSTYLGGTADDYGRGIAVDSAGNCYATGQTASSGWVSGGWNTSHGGSWDGFVVKLSTAGAHLWSTYLGGASADSGSGIAVDASGANTWVTGDTGSTGWVSGGWNTTLQGTDGFVVKLSAAGAHLWSTYLGGTGTDLGYGIAVDSAGNCYATGRTQSSGWVSGGWDTTFQGGDGFVVKLSTAGAHLWSTYLGGASDYGYGIAADASGNCYATGRTNLAGWVSGGWDTTHNGGSDGFVVKLSTAGAHLWSTYLGGTSTDYGYGIAVDSAGNCYATGRTQSSGWVSGGWQTAYGGGSYDGFVVKLSTAGAHLWSTYLGGASADYGYGIAVDASGANTWVTGYTGSTGWVSGGWDTSFGGSWDGFVLKATGLNDTGSLQVTLGPAGAVSAGAQWRPVTFPTWYNSGDTVTGLAAGEWAVEFKDVYGYAPPASHAVTVPAGGTGTDTGTYVAVSVDVEWSTYLGGTGDDLGYGIAVDSSGNCYATGFTASSGWVSGGWNTTLQGHDGFVVKLSAAGAHLWSTYLGGTGSDYGRGIAVDSSGNCYATGYTGSSGWVSGGWNTSFGGGNYDGFVVKLSTAGAHLWSTYLGGTGTDYGYGIAADASGNCYATGYTVSSGWVSGGWNTTYGGVGDAYVVKLSTAGAHLWSTYLGGTGDDTGYGIAVDATGDCYATAYTNSAGWVSGGWNTTLQGYDGFVVKLSAAGAHLWSTYLGGTSSDYGQGIAVDTSGNCYATGYTVSSGWVSGGWNTTLGGSTDGFVVKLSTAGAHLWSTYLGGTSTDYGRGIAADASGNCCATGYTGSSGWVSGSGDTTYGGGNDGFVVKLSTAGAHLWSTYLGGTSTDYGYGIAVDATGTNTWVTGYTSSADWVSGGWNTSHGGVGDAFVAKIVDNPVPTAPSNPGSTAVDLNTITWTWTDNSGNETGFKVYDDPGSGPPVTLQTTTAADVQLWQHGGLNPNAQYAFQVAATNANGDSALTTNYTAWTLIEAVSGLSFSGVTASGIGVGPANAPSNLTSGASGLYYANTTAGTNSGWVQTSAPWASGGLSPNTQYTFSGKSRNGGSVETAPVTASKYTLIEPSAGLTYSGFGLNTITVASTNVPSNLTLGSSGLILENTTTATDSGWQQSNAPWTSTPLLPNTAYTFTCRTRNAEGVVNVQQPLEVRYTLIEAVSGLAFSGVTPSSIGVGPANAPSNLASGTSGLYYANTTAGTNSGWVQTAAPWASGGLSPNTQYTFSGRSRNGDSVSTAPATASKWTLAAQPLAPSVTNATQHTLDVALTAGDGNPAGTEYAIRVDSGLPGNVWVQADGTLGAAPVYRTMPAWGAVTVTGLSGGTFYGVFGVARNGEGIDSAMGLAGYGQTLEDVPPAGTVVINGGAAYTNTTAAALTLSATDGGSGVAHMRFSNDNVSWSGWEAYATGKAWTLNPGDGAKTVYAQFRDGVGNVSAGPISDGITLDTVAPTVTLSCAAPDPTNASIPVSAVLSEPSVTFTQEDIAAVHASVSGFGGGGTSYQFTLVPSAQGPVSCSAPALRFSDLAGNQNAGASNVISRTYDSVAPAGSVTINMGDPRTNTRIVTLTVSATDATTAVTGMSFRNDGGVWGAWLAFAPTRAWQLSAGDGAKTVYARFRDAAGNVTAASLADSITLDTAEPGIGNIAAIPAQAGEDETVTLTFDVSEPLDAPPEVTVNGHAAVRDTEKAGYVYLYTVLGPEQDPLGPAYIEISGVDLAGNLGAAANSSALTIVEARYVPALSASMLALLAALTAAGGAAALRRRK